MTEMLLLTAFILLLVFSASCSSIIFICFKKEQKAKAANPKGITIGIFFGLLTKEGKVRLQKRTEKGSRITPGKSYQNNFELPGGLAKPTLIFSRLIKEGKRELREELGLEIIRDIPIGGIYRAVFISPSGKTDWALMIPVPSYCWDETAPMKREAVDVSPGEIQELADKPEDERLLGGWGKRMCRMALGAIVAGSTNHRYITQAKVMLTFILPDWRTTEYFYDAEDALAVFSKELSL